mgnify:FL=1
MRKSTSNKSPKKRRSINRPWRRWRRLNNPPKKRMSNFFITLGGADTEILKHVDSERNAFVSIGAVMLGTASFAALSMMIAMYNAVLVVSDPSTGQRAQQQPTINLIASIILGILWGVFILIVDRAMIKTMHGVYGLKQAFWYASPRLLLAFIIGLVVSTPLLLQIFRGEIAVQLQQDQTSQIEAIIADNAERGTGQALENKEQEIRNQLAILNGTADAGGNVDQATQAYNDAVEARDALQKEYERTQTLMECEDNPNQQICSDVAITGDPGRGDRYNSWRDELPLIKARLDNAIEEEKTALANKNASAQRAREEAHAALCGGASPMAAEASVFSEECSEGLQGGAHKLRQILARENDVESIVRSNNGLLAQIIALRRASFKTWTGILSHGAIAILFIVIELFPVFLKGMMAVRGESQYDRVFRKLQESELEKVEARNAQERERIDREARRTREIGEDMLQREIDLGKSANEKVAEQMRIILDQTLSHWTDRFQTMVAPYLVGVGENAERPADPARPEQTTASPARPEARPEQPADLGLLPDGSQLAALELGARIGSMGSPSASRDADHFSKRYQALLAIQDEAIRLQREADELAGVGLSAERARLEEMQHELMAAQTAEKEIVADIARHERALTIAKRERATLEEQRERLVGQVSEVGAERSRTQAEVDGLAEQVRRKSDEISVLEAHHRELKGRLDEANRLFDRLSSLGSAPIPAEAADLLRSIRALAQDLPGEEGASGADPRQ